MLQCFPLDYPDRNLTPLDSGAEPHPTDPHPQTRKIWHAPIISPLCLWVGIFVLCSLNVLINTYFTSIDGLYSTHFWFHSHFNCCEIFLDSEKSFRFKINWFHNSKFVISDLIDTKFFYFVVRLLLFKDNSLEFNPNTCEWTLCFYMICLLNRFLLHVVFFLMIKEYHDMNVKHECYFQI